MPITLTVSHLPSACSFFLNSLQPLGYRYFYGRRGKIGLGVHDADFFIQQSNDPPGTKPTPSHIRFHAPSRAAVREFYAAALYAGAKPRHSPGDRTLSDADIFNTVVTDRDGNSIEVSFTNDDPSLDGSEIDHGAVLSWQRGVADSARSHTGSHASRHSTQKAPSKAGQTVVSARQSAADGTHRSHISKRSGRSSARSAVSAHSASRAPATEVVSAPAPPSGAGDVMPTLYRHLSGPIETLLTKADPISGMVPKKTVVGTMLGAAAGAAFAYAMCASEDGKTRREQWRYVKWDEGGRPHYADGDATTIGPPFTSSSSRGLPEAMSRLALEAPTPPLAPEAPAPPSMPGSQRYSMRSGRMARSEVNVPSNGGSKRRSSSVHSARTAPVRSSHHSHSHASRRSSHPPPSSKHSHRTSRQSSRHSTSRSSATLVPEERPSDMKLIEPAPDMDLDVDAATVAPSDSISCAGDRYERSGARRSRSAGSSKYRSGFYGGRRAMDRIVEVERESEPISARRVTRLVY